MSTFVTARREHVINGPTFGTKLRNGAGRGEIDVVRVRHYRHQRLGTLERRWRSGSGTSWGVLDLVDQVGLIVGMIRAGEAERCGHGLPALWNAT